MVRMSRIWKLYLLYTVLLVAGMTLMGFILEDRLKNKLYEHLQDDVTTLAQVLGKVMPDTEDQDILKGFCKTYCPIARVRMTVIGGDGRVLADSEEKDAVGQSRLDRSEVQSALTGNTGFAVRFSDTLKMEMFYGAVLVQEKGKVLRLAMPMSRVKMFQNELMLLFSLALFMAPIIAMIVSFFVAKYKIYQGDMYKTGAWPRHL